MGKARTKKNSKRESKTTKEKTTLPRTLEEELLKDGYQYVIGVDEAGRGPLAGPVVAGACCMPLDLVLQGNLSNCHYFETLLIAVVMPGIDDSKSLGEKERERLFGEMKQDPRVVSAAAVVDRERIDEINILHAAMQAMAEAVEEVDREMAMRISKQQEAGGKAAQKGAKGGKKGKNGPFVLVDGNRVPGTLVPHLKESARSVVKGDAKEYIIGAASVIAKVTRDRIMVSKLIICSR